MLAYISGCQQTINQACCRHCQKWRRLIGNQGKQAVITASSPVIHRTKNVNFFVEESGLLDAALPLQPLDSVRLTLPLIIFVCDDTDGGKSSLANLSVSRLAVKSPH